MAVTAITSITAFLAPKLVSASVPAVAFILTQLAQKALSAVAGALGQAVLGAAASALKSRFSEEQRRNYFRFDITSSFSVSKAESDFHALREAQFSHAWKFSYEKAELAMQAANEYCVQAKQASVVDRPLFFQRARSVVWELLSSQGFMDTLNGSKSGQLKNFHHEISMDEARACQEAAEEAKSTQTKLAFVFAGITALRLGHSDLQVDASTYVMLQPEPSSSRYELGAVLWGEAALMLQSLREDADLDMHVFARVMHSERLDVFSLQHAAARCHFNRGLTLQFQKTETETAKHQLKNEIFLSFSAATVLFKEVKLPKDSSLEQRAWFEAEKFEVFFKRYRRDAPDLLVSAEEAIRLFEEAAAQTQKPLRFWIQIARLYEKAADASEFLLPKDELFPYFEKALEYAMKIRKTYPDFDISKWVDLEKLNRKLSAFCPDFHVYSPKK